MKEEELLKRTVEEVCNIFGANFVTKGAITAYILHHSQGRTEDIRLCSSRIHELIHEYNWQQYRNLNPDSPL
jgi:hypothetical protein